MTNMKILVVDDDHHIGELLTLHLEELGFSVTHIADGTRGLQLALTNTYDLIILDVMLPGKDGIEICRELRNREISAPIMMLTFRGDEVDKILGLELGADDYVTKPFSVREVVARVKALVRRSNGAVPVKDEVIDLGDLVINCSTREVSLSNKRLAGW
jgi:two-component system alkaline phosphatase synthesis response regulator PhoP